MSRTFKDAPRRIRNSKLPEVSWVHREHLIGKVVERERYVRDKQGNIMFEDVVEPEIVKKDLGWSEKLWENVYEEVFTGRIVTNRYPVKETYVKARFEDHCTCGIAATSQADRRPKSNGLFDPCVRRIGNHATKGNCWCCSEWTNENDTRQGTRQKLHNVAKNFVDIDDTYDVD